MESHEFLRLPIANDESHQQQYQDEEDLEDLHLHEFVSTTSVTPLVAF